MFKINLFKRSVTNMFEQLLQMNCFSLDEKVRKEAGKLLENYIVVKLIVQK